MLVRPAQRARRALWAVALAMLSCRRAPASHDEQVPAGATDGGEGVSVLSEGGPAAAATEARQRGRFWPLSPAVSLLRTERKDGEGRNTAWMVLRIDLEKAPLVAKQPPHWRLERMGEDPAVLFAVDGGFFETSGAPSGLLFSQGKRFGVWNRHAGSGILLVSKGRARLVSSATMPNLEGVDLAVQCGPRLVEPGGLVGIRHDDGKRAARTAACIRQQGRELDLVLAWTRNSDRDGPGLLELAEWLVAPLASSDTSGCEAALNLDGGPSTGVYLRGLPDESHKAFGPVPWALLFADSSESHDAGESHEAAESRDAADAR